MQLLSETELVWSPVVANSAMNRERNSSGINSYEKECKFSPEQYLATHIKTHGSIKWLDLCCGQGKALIQTATCLADSYLQDKARLTGIDIIDAFLPVPPSVKCLSFVVASVAGWRPANRYDLITCIHGLHYVGDKLKVIANALGSLTTDGLFIANLDLQNIHVDGSNSTRHLKDYFRKHSIHYNAKTKILSCKGVKNIDFGLRYKGASDKAGPNYTGQEAVNAYYIPEPVE